jgi:hypothetical protein
MYTILAVILALYLGFNKKPGPLWFAAECLNDIGLVGEESRRLYFYSKQDDIVLSEFVEEHAIEAKEKGLKVVEMGIFKKDAHVIDDEVEYWRAIAGL